ncbi:MAG: hypothetical protein K1X79_05930 [Oligoflexia bacterium]|nr:hypothetical protein [Oligoflexia bacterium]
MKKVCKQKTSSLMNGQVKRLFISDFHLARLAGLTRSQAFKICWRKYVEQ